ncbi:MAG: class II aldolase/adducin family protein [Candidatus Methanoperedens sp.]|jgi:L-fuculose-phosphate aldolase|nr:class II aldolase/adducin family protein [Candidatus Methanoperedens sp.]PKL52961.1 MAG: class II aldolase family protein [Candidatus Methanoperedenaceae archaeon HGW-Methanoperedenaceae-1]
MDIITACRKIAEKGLVAGASGNVSERAGSSFHITASGVRLDSVRSAKDLVKCDTGSDAFITGASMETRMHRAIYRQRPDAWAVIHANPPFSTVVACAPELTVDTSLIPEGALLNPVCRVGAYPAGSNELAEAVGLSAGKSNVLILKNHGVVTVGANMEEALNRLEYLELICRIIVTAKSAGIVLGGGGVSGYR